MTTAEASPPATRAIIVLCITQVLGWGFLFYPPALTMSYIAAERGWSLAQTLSGFSLALVGAGLIAPFACGEIDRRGGRLVMSVGALSGACGLALIPLAPNFAVYVIAWLLIGVAMSSILYDPAFATLTRVFGAASRRPITIVTFAGGLASTVAWPATLYLIETYGWQGAYYVFAAALAFIAAPLHAFLLPASSVVAATAAPAVLLPNAPPPAVALKPEGWPFVLVAAGFAGHAFVLSGMSAHLLPILQRGGLSATTTVAIGALFGPAQVLSRLADFLSGSRIHPLWVARGAMALMALAFTSLVLIGLSPVLAAVFAVAFGASNGVMTIARGALPLTMFGATGYGRVLGRIARPAQILQALSPFALAYVIDRASDRIALEIIVVMIVLSLLCFVAIKKPE